MLSPCSFACVWFDKLAIVFIFVEVLPLMYSLLILCHLVLCMRYVYLLTSSLVHEKQSSTHRLKLAIYWQTIPALFRSYGLHIRYRLHLLRCSLRHRKVGCRHFSHGCSETRSHRQEYKPSFTTLPKLHKLTVSPRYCSRHHGWYHRHLRACR